MIAETISIVASLKPALPRVTWVKGGGAGPSISCGFFASQARPPIHFPVVRVGVGAFV